MKIILTHEVTSLGAPGDIVEVKDGYGRNYLLPRGSRSWHPGAEKQVAHDQARRASAREIRDLDHAKEIKAELEELNVTLTAKAAATPAGSSARSRPARSSTPSRPPAARRSTSAPSSSPATSRRSASTPSSPPAPRGHGDLTLDVVPALSRPPRKACDTNRSAVDADVSRRVSLHRGGCEQPDNERRVTDRTRWVVRAATRREHVPRRVVPMLSTIRTTIVELRKRKINGPLSPSSSTGRSRRLPRSSPGWHSLYTAQLDTCSAPLSLTSTAARRARGGGLSFAGSLPGAAPGHRADRTCVRYTGSGG